VPELIAKSALDGARLSRAGCTLAEVPVGPITSVAPYPGRDKAVARALKPLKLAFPAPNTTSRAGTARLVWSGLDQAFLIGVPAPEALAAHAALTDQSDGWCALALSGPAAADALMRLIPLDLRLAAFPVGRSVRAPLNHMALILGRPDPDSFELLVFRSMARTAWHEIEDVLTRLEARTALG
jgi:sarcosine oxidase subunit gamma